MPWSARIVLPGTWHAVEEAEGCIFIGLTDILIRPAQEFLWPFSCVEVCDIDCVLPGIACLTAEGMRHLNHT